MRLASSAKHFIYASHTTPARVYVRYQWVNGLGPPASANLYKERFKLGVGWVLARILYLSGDINNDLINRPLYYWVVYLFARLYEHARYREPQTVKYVIAAEIGAIHVRYRTGGANGAYHLVPPHAHAHGSAASSSSSMPSATFTMMVNCAFLRRRASRWAINR
jgi:hypothetical protein